MQAVRTLASLCLCKELRPPFLYIETGRLESTPIERHDTLLAPLAPKPQRSLGPSNGLHIECRKLRDARTGSIEQLEHRRIAQPRRRRGIGSFEECLHLLVRQHTGRSRGSLGEEIAETASPSTTPSAAIHR